eukprot:Pgem_evm1s8536
MIHKKEKDWIEQWRKHNKIPKGCCANGYFQNVDFKNLVDVAKANFQNTTFENVIFDKKMNFARNSTEQVVVPLLSESKSKFLSEIFDLVRTTKLDKKKKLELIQSIKKFQLAPEGFIKLLHATNIMNKHTLVYQGNNVFTFEVGSYSKPYRLGKCVRDSIKIAGTALAVNTGLHIYQQSSVLKKDFYTISTEFELSVDEFFLTNILPKGSGLIQLVDEHRRYIIGPVNEKIKEQNEIIELENKKNEMQRKLNEKIDQENSKHNMYKLGAKLGQKLKDVQTMYLNIGKVPSKVHSEFELPHIEIPVEDAGKFTKIPKLKQDCALIKKIEKIELIEIVEISPAYESWTALGFDFTVESFKHMFNTEFALYSRIKEAKKTAIKVYDNMQRYAQRYAEDKLWEELMNDHFTEENLHGVLKATLRRFGVEDVYISILAQAYGLRNLFHIRISKGEKVKELMKGLYYLDSLLGEKSFANAVKTKAVKEVKEQIAKTQLEKISKIENAYTKIGADRAVSGIERSMEGTNKIHEGIEMINEGQKDLLISSKELQEAKHYISLGAKISIANKVRKLISDPLWKKAKKTGVRIHDKVFGNNNDNNIEQFQCDAGKQLFISYYNSSGKKEKGLVSVDSSIVQVFTGKANSAKVIVYQCGEEIIESSLIRKGFGYLAKIGSKILKPFNKHFNAGNYVQNSSIEISVVRAGNIVHQMITVK